MAPFDGRGSRDFFSAGQANGKVGTQRIHRFFHRLAIILAVRRHPGKIDELHHYPAVATSLELRGIRKSGHQATSHSSCRFILRSRHILTKRSLPISLLRSLSVVNSSRKYSRPQAALPLVRNEIAGDLLSPGEPADSTLEFRALHSFILGHLCPNVKRESVRIPAPRGGNPNTQSTPPWGTYVSVPSCLFSMSFWREASTP